MILEMMKKFTVTHIKKTKYWCEETSRNLTSFLTLEMARFSAFFIPRVVSSRKDVCTTKKNSNLLELIHSSTLIVSK
jgi:hypothetical protein